MNLIERSLRRWFPFKELGWESIGEKFTRWTIFKCRWFSIYVHKLDAPVRHPKCHDHPWHFWAVLLTGGYWEEMNGKKIWRRPGSVLYRTARSLHNTITKPGKPNWSIIVVSKKVRDWGMKTCDEPGHWLTEKK